MRCFYVAADIYNRQLRNAMLRYMMLCPYNTAVAVFSSVITVLPCLSRAYTEFSDHRGSRLGGFMVHVQF